MEEHEKIGTQKKDIFSPHVFASTMLAIAIAPVVAQFFTSLIPGEAGWFGKNPYYGLWEALTLGGKEISRAYAFGFRQGNWEEAMVQLAYLSPTLICIVTAAQVGKVGRVGKVRKVAVWYPIMLLALAATLLVHAS